MSPFIGIEAIAKLIFIIHHLQKLSSRNQLYNAKTNTTITANVVERVLQFTYIFNNIILVFKLQMIKASLKSDIVVIWIDIWDTQSSIKAKSLINRCFNVNRHITTIYSMNMNLGIQQYKNCWKWEHTTFACHVHSSKCIKCNGHYKLEYYRDIAWYCKANFKINLPRLEMKKGEHCLYLFKCVNCKGKHQAGSNTCLFWRHCFNKEWHTKKYQELCKDKSKSIHSTVDKANL